MSYDNIWRELEQAAVSDVEGTRRRRVEPDAACDLYLAVSKPANRRLLIMPVGGIPADLIGDLPAARGVEVSVVDDPARGPSLQLALLDDRFAGIYTTLVTDLVAVVAAQPSLEGAVVAFIERLERWQRLLQRAPTDLLTRAAQQGLYGELWFMRERLLVGTMTGRVALTAWTGPSGAPQDYHLGACAIEVKTTGTDEPQRMMINGARQLGTLDDTPLILFHVSVDAREGGNGESLASMVASIRRALTADPAAQDLLDDRLLDVGYLNAHEAAYEKVRYTVRETHAFRVAEAFPRLVETDLPPGVGHVHYAIDVSACMPFVVTRDALDVLLMGVADGQ